MGRKRGRPNNTLDSDGSFKETQPPISSFLNSESSNESSSVIKKIESVEANLLKEYRDLSSKVKDDFESLMSSMHDILVHNEKFKKEIDGLKKENKELKEELYSLRLNNWANKQFLNKQEQYSRKKNVQILGIRENKNETEQESETQALSIFHKIGVTISPTNIDIAHRIGRQDRNKPRPIIVRFTNLKHKVQVIKNRYKLKGKNIVIVEDLTRQNRELYNQVRALDFVVQTWTKNGEVFAKGRGGVVVQVEHGFEQSSFKRRLENSGASFRVRGTNPKPPSKELSSDIESVTGPPHPLAPAPNHPKAPKEGKDNNTNERETYTDAQMTTAPPAPPEHTPNHDARQAGVEMDASVNNNASVVSSPPPGQLVGTTTTGVHRNTPSVTHDVTFITSTPKD